ncbi:hypothetical protein AAG570_010495 [Ranatra chinensis]|uniref:Gustatory receptor n=1 Tax=Ranatra chinensis TaxID=642074 RepID=A0ABD0YMQ0_9HEMI
MASKRRNTFYENKKLETTEIGPPTLEEFASNMKGEKISLRLKRFVLAIVLTNPPGAALCLIAENFLLTNMSWYDLLPYTFAYSSCNLTYLFWAANCYEIARISETLSKKTVEAIRARNSEGLRRCRCLWIGLSLLARGLGCSLGLTGLLNTTILSGCFILTCYALLTAIINNQFIDSILSLVILLPVNFTYTFILVDTAHKATQKVGMDFSSVVIKESRMLSDEMCQKEVSLLLNAINTNPPVITLNGFVDVNRALFASSVTFRCLVRARAVLDPLNLDPLRPSRNLFSSASSWTHAYPSRIQGTLDLTTHFCPHSTTLRGSPPVACDWCNLIPNSLQTPLIPRQVTVVALSGLQVYIGAERKGTTPREGGPDTVVDATISMPDSHAMGPGFDSLRARSDFTSIRVVGTSRAEGFPDLPKDIQSQKDGKLPISVVSCFLFS